MDKLKLLVVGDGGVEDGAAFAVGEVVDVCPASRQVDAHRRPRRDPHRVRDHEPQMDTDRHRLAATGSAGPIICVLSV